MKFIIEINCENDAFQGDATEEVKRILSSLIPKIDADDVRTAIPLHDSMGNRVGFATFK